MKRRILSTLMALVLVFGLLPATALAAEGESTTPAVYVSSAGDDTNGNGSEDKPFATLAKAVGEAVDGATIYVMSDLTMTSCARFYNKSLTITSLGDATCTITRGDNFAQQQDNARSWYNPAMIEVQTTGDVGAGLTLTNIIFDDTGKKEGTVFAQAVSDGSVGATSNDNLVYVQDAIIASNATVPSTITLGDGAVLRNFGGMSAVRATGEAKLVMEPGSVIEDDSAVITTRGSDADETNAAKGPAGAVWLQGSDFEMKSGAEIKNVNGRAVYADGGEVTIGGTISGITGNANMWQATKKDGTSGTAIHLRGENASAVLTSTTVIEEISGGGSAVYVTGVDNHFLTAKGSTIRKLTQAIGVNCVSNKDTYLNGQITEVSGAIPLRLQTADVVLGEDGIIHKNELTSHGAAYVHNSSNLTIYGKINDNYSSSGKNAAALFIVPNGAASHATLEPGGEICNNTNNGNKYGAAVELQQGSCSFTMNGGTISGNSGPCGAVQVHKDSAKFIMNGGEVTGNTSTTGGEAGIYVEYKTPTVELNAGKAQSITLAANVSALPSKGHVYISDRFDLESGLVTMTQDTKTVTPAADSLNIKLGNASLTSVTTLTTASTDKGWKSPLATFWAQRNGGSELTVGGLVANDDLPVYVLTLPVDETGAVSTGAAPKVFAAQKTGNTGEAKFTLPDVFGNGCAVALAQPTKDFGSVDITGPAEIAESYGAVTYEVPYTATYTMAGSLLSMLKLAQHGVPMTFVVELDSRLTAKKGVDGKFLYDFDGAGILEVDENSITVNGNKITVLCNPVTDWTNAVKNKTSVVMTLKGTGVLAATGFDAGKYLNTTGHIEGAIGSLPVMIPANVCRTKMTAQTFTVTYRGNGADSGRIADITAYTPGEIATVKANGYTRDGCTFTGWNTEPDGSGAPYKTGDRITMTGNVVLYAQWTRNSSGDDGDTGYTLRLTKLDAGNGTPLSGAKFELWRVGTRSDTRLGVYETNRYGWTQAEVSQSGDYYWVETVPPEGYRLGGGKHPTNTGKNSRITVYNTEAAVPALFTDDHYAYIVGVPGGTVRPNDSMTRAGVATIFFRLLKDSVRDANLLTGCTYTDVPDGHWANTAISTMTGLDIVRGYDAAAFGPGDPITRAQFAAICARFDTGKSNGSRTFSDIEGHWAKAYIERAAELGWISGFQDGTFRPDAYITRAQAVTMINRMLNRLPEDPSDLLPGMNVWPDCGPGDWFYLAIQEATNSHDYRHKAGSYEIWTGLNADPDWTRYEN